MPRNNRRAGHGYELDTAALLRRSGLFPLVVTSRSENRTRDGQKVDLINSDETVNGRMEYNIQCKNSSGKVNYHQLLKEMPVVGGIINVIFHKHTVKSKGGKFVAKGEYALLNREDFLTVMKERRGFEILSEILKKHYDLLPEGVRQEIITTLSTIGL